MRQICATLLNQSQEPSLPSQVPIYPWVDRISKNFKLQALQSFHPSKSPPPKLTAWDVADCKEADSCIAVHRPFLRLAVGLATVVHEARQVSFGSGVYDAILVQGEEVEIGDIVVMGLADPLPALFFIH